MQMPLWSNPRRAKSARLVRPVLMTLEDRNLPGGGALDSTFGSDGQVVAPLGHPYAHADAVTTDLAGRVLVAGTIDGTNSDMLLARYLDDGSLDPSFAGDGIAVSPFGPIVDTGYALAVDGAGRILVAGGAHTGGGAEDFALARFLPDGSLDTSFGTGGFVTTDIGGAADRPQSVLVDAAGRIVVAGYSGNSTFDFALV